MNLRRTNGFTLVELLLAVMILAGAISGVLLLFTTSMVTSEQAWDTTMATTHAEHVLEEMQRVGTLSGIVSVNWRQWAVDQGLNTLPNEEINVNFENTLSDPLNITVIVNWLRKSRTNEIAVYTRMTK